MSPARRAVYAQEAEAYDALTRQEGFVPLRTAFAESPEPVYYRTDHHWNFQGAYLAYRAFLK